MSSSGRPTVARCSTFVFPNIPHLRSMKRAASLSGHLTSMTFSGEVQRGLSSVEACNVIRFSSNQFALGGAELCERRHRDAHVRAALLIAPGAGGQAIHDNGRRHLPAVEDVLLKRLGHGE